MAWTVYILYDIFVGLMYEYCLSISCNLFRECSGFVAKFVHNLLTKRAVQSATTVSRELDAAEPQVGVKYSILLC